MKKSSQHLDISEAGSFDMLARKLEGKITRIEKEVQESIDILEVDIHKLIHKNKNRKVEKEVREDLSRLSKLLENRIKNSIDKIIKNRPTKSDRDELKMVKNLSSQLTKILSVDFYKNVLGKLQQQDFKTEVDEFGMDQSLINKLKPFFDFLYYKYWRVSTTGLQNIPSEGCALITGNHSGTVPYDGAMIKTAVLNEHPIRKDVRFLVEDFVYHMPMLGSFMYRIGGVRACPENAQTLLEHGHLVVVFPEGVKGIGKYYNERYKLQRFGRGGFIKLCLSTQAPLIPVGVIGAEEIHPIILKSNVLAKTIGIPYIPITPTFPLLGLLGMIPFPSKWAIHFGTPLHFENYPLETKDDELTIHKLSEQVRDQIQQIIIDLLKKRRSVLMG